MFIKDGKVLTSEEYYKMGLRTNPPPRSSVPPQPLVITQAHTSKCRQCGKYVDTGNGHDWFLITKHTKQEHSHSEAYTYFHIKCFEEAAGTDWP